MSNIKCQISNVKCQTVALALICSLAACSGSKTPAPPGSIQTAAPGGLQAPTWTPAAPGGTATVAVPYPDSLTTAELDARLDPFVSPDCKLPCYNGITPGQSGMQEALNFYARLGISALDMQPGDYAAAQDGAGNLGAVLIRRTDVDPSVDVSTTSPRVDLRLDGNIVRSVYVSWRVPPAYVTVARVLEVMGQPDQFDLALVFGTGNPTYVLQLVYTASQTGFAFLGEAPSDGSQLLVCLSNDRLNATLMGIAAPGEPPMAGQSHENYLLPIEGTLGLSFSDFAGQASAGGCLSIPASMWGPWQALGGN